MAVVGKSSSLPSGLSNGLFAWLVVISLVILFRCYDEFTTHARLAPLNFTLLVQETPAAVADYKPFAFVPKLTVNLSDGTAVVLEPAIITRGQKGMTMPLDYVGNSQALFWSHTVGALIWSLLAPLQVVDGLRKAMPALHRWSGRLLLLTAAVLTVSGFGFYVMDIGMTMHYNEMPLVLPLYEMATFTSTVGFAVSTYFAYVTAVAGDFVAHRKWVMRHLGVGYGIGFIRFFHVTNFIVFNTLRDYIPFGLGELTGRNAYWLEAYSFATYWFVGAWICIYVAEKQIARLSAVSAKKTH